MAPVAVSSERRTSMISPIIKSSQTWRPTEVANPPTRTSCSFDSIESALEAFAAGEFVVVMDDEGRENEGDLIISGSQCTTEKMAWMIKQTRYAFTNSPLAWSWGDQLGVYVPCITIFADIGFICIALPAERLEALEIPMMVEDNQDRNRTAYTVTVDYKHGTTTGISASDRSLTVRALASPTSVASDFSRPGHMVPLRAREGGVLTRKGHTESGVDLCFLTGQQPAGVLCEIVNDDAQGTMARRDDCRAFADRWGLKMITVDILAQYKRLHMPTNGQS